LRKRKIKKKSFPWQHVRAEKIGKTNNEEKKVLFSYKMNIL